LAELETLDWLKGQITGSSLLLRTKKEAVGYSTLLLQHMWQKAKARYGKRKPFDLLIMHDSYYRLSSSESLVNTMLLKIPLHLLTSNHSNLTEKI
jgi:hypothetical protein